FVRSPALGMTPQGNWASPQYHHPIASPDPDWELAAMTRLFLGLLAVALLTVAARAEEKPKAVGAAVPDVGGLRDVRGNARALHGFKGHKAVVAVFLGTDCPISNLYVPSLLEIEKRYRTQNVLFLALYPNAGEDLDQVAIHSHDRDLPFPVLKDV